jgi:hypothetical protein
MITRYAIFNGTVKPGYEAEMQAWVSTHLSPLWRQFTGARDVQVLFHNQQDPNGPPIPLILAVTYDTHADIEKALASPARHKSKAMLPDFYAQFFDDVTLWHYTMEHEVSQ